MRRRAGREVVRVFANLSSRLQPLPGAPEHRTEELCLHGGGPERGRRAAGRLPGARRAADARRTPRLRSHADDADGLRTGRDAAPRPSASAAAARSPSRRARRRSGAPAGSWRASSPRGEAIRSAAAIDASGACWRAAGPRSHRPTAAATSTSTSTTGASTATSSRGSGRRPAPKWPRRWAATAAASWCATPASCCAPGSTSLDLDGGDCYPPPYKDHQHPVRRPQARLRRRDLPRPHRRDRHPATATAGAPASPRRRPRATPAATAPRCTSCWPPRRSGGRSSAPTCSTRAAS